MNNVRRALNWSLLTTALGAARGVQAQTALATLPAQSVIWSGFPPGGLGDQVTRPLLERLKGRWPGLLILDSKPGAGGRIAVDFVKRANADGATLLQLPSSPMTIYPHTYGKKLNYDPLTDFVPVTPLAAYTISLTVGPVCRPKCATWRACCAGRAPTRSWPTTASPRRVRCRT